MKSPAVNNVFENSPIEKGDCIRQLKTNNKLMNNIVRIVLPMVVMATLILQACNNSSNAKQSAAQLAKEKEYQFLDKYQVKEASFTDSTDIRFNSKEELSTKEKELLKVDQITKDKTTRCIINYRVNLSDDFKTIVYCVFPSENEIKSVLVNYDADYNIIDQTTVAYDEIAEGLLNTYSIIQKNEIETVEQTFGEEANSINLKTFDLAENGKIIAHTTP